MAAPGTAYTGKKLPIKLSGGAKLDSDLALKLAEYGSAIKSLFYLDRLLIVNGAFVGAVEDNPGSFNYRHHNPARFSKIRIKGPDGKRYILLKDAGLNTRGNTLNNIVDSTTTIGNLKLKADFLSAYYVDTDSYGVKWKINNGGYNTSVIGTTQAQQWSASGQVQLTSTGGAFQAGDTIHFKPYITNVEGTFEGDEWSAVIAARQVSANTGSYASYACSGSYGSQTIYITKDNDDITIGDKFYSSATVSGVNEVSYGGYFSFDGWWFEYGLDAEWSDYRILDKGLCGAWPIGDPANGPAYETFDWAEYSNVDYTNACSVSGSNQNPRTTYKSNTDGLHYSDTALTTLAYDGWYTVLNGSALYDWVAIENGIETSTGSC